MSSSFRDLAVLPFVNNVSEAKIFKICIATYTLAVLVFTGSVYAYSTAESLKLEKIVTSVEPIAGMDCTMLTSVRLTVDSGLAGAMFLTSQGKGGKCNGVTFPAISPSSLEFVYMGYFENFAECQSQANLRITSVTPGTSGGSVEDYAKFESDTGTDSKISLRFPGGLHGCDFTPDTLYSFLETNLPNINERLCSPWEHNPPFQCSKLEALSPLSIVSQSLAIATSALSLFVFLANRSLLTQGSPSDSRDGGALQLSKVATALPSSSPADVEAAVAKGEETEKDEVIKTLVEKPQIS